MSRETFVNSFWKPVRKNQPKFHGDIELTKINLLAEEWRSGYRDVVNYYLTALIALLAVELTVGIGIELSGNYWAGIVYFLTFVFLEGPFFVFLLYRTGKRYKTKLRKVNSLIKKVESEEPLGDFESLMKDAKGTDSKNTLRRIVRFGLSCFALSAILFAIQYIILYDQSVINGNTSTYVTTSVKSLSSWVDWTAGVAIAVFFGGLMIGALILVIPWNMLEKIAAIRRGKKLVGL